MRPFSGFRVALAQTVFHNKESLVLIRSVKRGLLLHFLFFKNEIRDFDAIAKGENVKTPTEQLELGRGLIEKIPQTALHDQPPDVEKAGDLEFAFYPVSKVAPHFSHRNPYCPIGTLLGA